MLKTTPILPNRKLAMISVENIGKFVVYIFEHRDEFLGRAIDIGSDNISGEESAEIFTRIIGKKIRYVEQEYADIAVYGEDMIRMYKWFIDVRHNINIDKLYKDFPQIGWHSFEDWVKEQDWTILD